jgi:hypothetical protein
MNNTREMDGWAMYTWRSTELTTTKEEKTTLIWKMDFYSI